MIPERLDRMLYEITLMCNYITPLRNLFSDLRLMLKLYDAADIANAVGGAFEWLDKNGRRISEKPLTNFEMKKDKSIRVCVICGKRKQIEHMKVLRKNGYSTTYQCLDCSANIGIVLRPPVVK